MSLFEIGETALVIASYKGHLEVVRILVESGADLNNQNTFGNILSLVMFTIL